MKYLQHSTDIYYPIAQLDPILTHSLETCFLISLNNDLSEFLWNKIYLKLLKLKTAEWAAKKHHEVFTEK